MEFTHDNVVKWFNNYFDTFNKNAGPLETVPNMEKFFSPDLEFWSYNMANAPRPSTREDLLMSMIHPGLHEELTPQYYVVDENEKIVVVQFQLQFNDEPSGTVWPARMASAHYHLAYDENNDLKIKKILYFTEANPPSEEPSKLMELWRKYREKALAEKQK